jgi:hypothetical protein
MGATPSRIARGQETYFYNNREQPTSSLRAGPRPNLNIAHLAIVRRVTYLWVNAMDRSISRLRRG